MTMFKKLSASLLFTGMLAFTLSCNDTGKQDRKAQDSLSNKKTDSEKPAGKELRPDSSVVSVAFLRKSADGKSVEVLFNERESIYRISRDDKNFEGFNRSVEEALKSGRPMSIVTSDKLLRSVRPAEGPELETYNEIRKQIIRGENMLAVDVRKIDTSKFNDLENLKIWPAFRLCATVVPSYTKAKEIFDFCAKQSCHLPGPYDIDNCIPFQYVPDGCYARAHKMRWIIEQKFRYCSQKVFSFAHLNNDELSVKADKWGGCCINWWYHVAPLIKVKVNFGPFTLTRAYVIDPAMFNQPVLLSTWLAAQENPACSNNAHVSMYSIQPSSAYSPLFPVGTNFTTDPNYTATNAKLIQYRNLISCY